MLRFTALSIAIAFVFLVVPMATAEETPPKPNAGGAEQYDGEVQTGVVASFGKSSRTAEVDYVDTSTSGDKASPIVGSISRKGDNCVATLTNRSSKNKISVSAKVHAGSGAKYMSATLAPGRSTKKTVRCGAGVDSASVEIVRAKIVGQRR